MDEINNVIKTNKKQNLFDKTFSLTTRELFFWIAIILCLSPLVSPPVALIIGLLFAQFIGHPYVHLNHRATSILLQVSVVGLGLGMNIHNAVKAGKDGIMFTVISITGTLLIGILLGKIFKTNKKTSYLISSGTAICGGSAIAAISPIIKAKENQISVALGVVFILNSIALFLFPVIGHLLSMTEREFGVWCAIAIHDTSSVVGASSKFGNEALQIATTVKLTRALWIIPVSLITSFIFKTPKSKIKIPYFIGLFIVAILLNSYIPAMQRISGYTTSAAKAGLTLTLFLIGSGLSKKTIRQVGFKPLFQGFLLWILISVVSLIVIKNVI